MTDEPGSTSQDPEGLGEPGSQDSTGLDELHEGPVGDGEKRELTLAEEQHLREAAARIRSVLNPRIMSAMAEAQKHGALAKFAADSARINKIMPKSILKGVLGKGVVSADFQSKTLAKLVSQFNVSPPWMKQVKLINADVYKFGALGQSNLTALNSILAMNADFGFNDTAAKMAARFASQQNSLLSTIGSKLASFKFNIYPPNLQDVEGLRIEEVEAVVMLDGIALYRAPRREIAEKIIRAKSTADRRGILGRRWKAISADCRAVLDECASASVASYVSFARSALDALDGGNAQAAQALAASVLDTVVNGYFGTDRYKFTPDMKGKRTTEEYDKFTVREFIAFAPLWQAYQKYKVEDGDPIPRTFSRHASVHGVSPQQFSRRNAVQALLFVCGLLAFLDEEAAKLEAA